MAQKTKQQTNRPPAWRVALLLCIAAGAAVFAYVMLRIELPAPPPKLGAFVVEAPPAPPEPGAAHDPTALAQAVAVLPSLIPGRNFSGPYLAARYAQNTGDWAGASSYMQWAVHAHRDDPDLARHAMVLAMGAGAPDQAARLARQVVAQSEDAPLAHLVLVAYALSTGNSQEAAEHVAALSEEHRAALGPDPADRRSVAHAFLDQARSMWGGQEDDGARLFVQMARVLDPELGEASFMMGQIHAAYDQDAQALAYFRAVPGPEGRQAEAETLARLGRTDQAIAVLEALAAEAEPEVRAETFVQIGDIHRAAEQWASAIAAYDQALAIMAELGAKPGAPGMTLFLRAMARDGADDWPGAQADLEAALVLRSDDPDILNYLGYSWVDRGENLPEATEMLERAVAARPGSYHIIDSVGWAHYRQGRWDEAVARLEDAVALAPYDDVVGDHLGDAYWRAGRQAEARFQWRRALNHTDDEDLAARIREKLRVGLP